MRDEAEAGTTSTIETTPLAVPPAYGPEVIRDWLARAAELYPGKPYLHSIEQGKAITYGELQQTALRIGAYLRARSIGPNDRVVLLANNSLEHLVVYVSVLAYGATICTVHVEMNRSHFDLILPALEPSLVLYEEGLGLEALSSSTKAAWLPLGTWTRAGGSGFFDSLSKQSPDQAAATAAGPEDDAAIYFTSGTSARPKGVVLTYRELMINAAYTADAFGMGPDDRIYDFRSFNWASAQILSALAPISKAATLILGVKFSRSHFFQHIAEHKATMAAGNPTTINMLLQGDDVIRGEQLPHLRFVTSSSAPLLVEEWRRFEDRFGIRIAQGYGSSETGWIAGCTDKTRRYGAVGKPLAYHRTSIVDANGRTLPAGEIGYVEIGGFADNKFRYIGDDGKIHVVATGRTKTGDMGFLDAEGYLHLTGREKDLIIRGGVNIAPLEIDAVLMQLPDIVEAATVGVPDKIYGEEVVSYVVIRPGATLSTADIERFCGERLPAFKAPKRIELRPSLPKTERGKLDRKALVAAWKAANGIAA